jgi:hypothetical protein
MDGHAEGVDDSLDFEDQWMSCFLIWFWSAFVKLVMALT